MSLPTWMVLPFFYIPNKSALQNFQSFHLKSTPDPSPGLVFVLVFPDVRCLTPASVFLLVETRYDLRGLRRSHEEWQYLWDIHKLYIILFEIFCFRIEYLRCLRHVFSESCWLNFFTRPSCLFVIAGFPQDCTWYWSVSTASSNPWYEIWDWQCLGHVVPDLFKVLIQRPAKVSRGSLEKSHSCNYPTARPWHQPQIPLIQTFRWP